LFPHGKARESALGWTQAFGSMGGLSVALVNGWIAGKPGEPGWAAHLPAIALPDFLAPWLGQVTDHHAIWRYTLMSGLIPAIPLAIIRPFLPESPAWREKRAAGTLRRPSYTELFSPALRRTAVVSTLMMACTFGVAFGAIQQMPAVVPGVPEVANEVRPKVEKEFIELVELDRQLGALQTGGGLGSPDGQRRFEELKAKTEAARAKYMRERKKLEQPYISKLQTRQEIGGLIGRAVLALLAIVIVSRRLLLALYLVPLLVLAPYVFAILGTTDWNLLLIGMPVVAALTIGQMSFWGNYLPRVFPLHLRGTGESFAA